MKPKISMITLGVRDLTAAIDFSEKGLGFPRMESPPEVAFFTLNGTWIGLYGREALAEDAQVSAEGQGFGAFTLAHNVASEKEVDEVVAQAVAAGAKLVKEPQKVFWGGYSGYFKDLDGHLWEVAQVILYTGFSGQITEEKARSVGIYSFLLKPVLFHDLATTLRKVLDESQKSSFC